MLYIKKVELENLRCFRDIEIPFDLRSVETPWTMFTGDNATGKTTLIQAMALGLNDMSSAAALLREHQSPYVRYEEETARILIELGYAARKDSRTFSIETTIHAPSEKGGPFERVDQRTYPKGEVFPWKHLFACGYGISRSYSASGDISGYQVINSVYALFNYSEGLQNPELVIRRLPDEKQRQAFALLANILQVERVQLATKQDRGMGIILDGAWGDRVPLRNLSDGYKSTFTWVTDLIGWSLAHRPLLRTLKGVTGIVFIDELEQHLHPKWQRDIVSLLREQFPNIQFITTTHSPIIARSIGGFQDPEKLDVLWHLTLKSGNEAKAEPHPTMKGWRSDQILASEAFDWLVDADPSVERVLRRASELAAKGEQRDSGETREFNRVMAVLPGILLSQGRTLIERQIESDAHAKMSREIRELEDKLFGDGS